MLTNKLLNDYSRSCHLTELGNKLNDLENDIGIVDKKLDFKNLVNPSQSKDMPFYSWGRYREAYSGELVSRLLEIADVDPMKNFIFDPMCGSGSTLVASEQMGFDALGIDVMPYSVKLTNSKFLSLTEEEISLVKSIISRPAPLSEAFSKSHTKKYAGMENYFSQTNFKQIISIKTMIDGIGNSKVKSLNLVAWLSILEACSDKKKDGNGLAKRISKVSDCWDLFTRTLNQYLEDISSKTVNGCNTLAICDSALNSAEIVSKYPTEKSLGAIVFSPPYANSFDYFESYKIELVMGGWFTLKSLPEGRTKAIRSYRKGYRDKKLESKDQLINLICEEIETRRKKKEENGKKDGRSRLLPNLIVGYFEDMENVLKEFKEIMPSGSSCFIVVDQSAYLGTVVPTDLILAYLAKKLDFIVKPLMYCRGSSTSPQQLKKFPYLKGMLRESIVHLIQP